MSNVVEFPTTEKPITEGSTPEHFAIWKVGGTTSPKRQCSRCSRSRLC
jgi:hypothetical protein